MAHRGAPDGAALPPSGEVSALDLRAALAEQRAELLAEQLRELREDRDAWRAQAERLALTAARPEPPPSAAPAPTLAAVQTGPEIATQDQGTPEPEAPKAEPSASRGNFWRRLFDMG